MKLAVTEKQYALVKRVLPVMAELYRNKTLPIFELIEAEYSSEKGTAAQAAALVEQLHITAPNMQKANDTERLLSVWVNDADVIQDGPYKFVIQLEDRQQKLLAKSLDAFSRIVMGQFFILFETLDISDSLQTNLHAFQAYQDVYWGGLHGAKEMRDMLMPAIKQFGWHGGYGISNPNVAECSRLAYQLSHAILREYALPVTAEPMAQVK